jgi:hypothetical protein
VTVPEVRSCRIFECARGVSELVSIESEVAPGTENPVCNDTGRDLLAAVPEAEEGGAESDDLSKDANDFVPHATDFGAGFLTGSGLTGLGCSTWGVLITVAEVSGSCGICAASVRVMTAGTSCCAETFAAILGETLLYDGVAIDEIEVLVESGEPGVGVWAIEVAGVVSVTDEEVVGLSFENETRRTGEDEAGVAGGR